MAFDDIKEDAKPLLIVDGYTRFLVNIITKGDDLKTMMEFEVYEVESWECDGEKTPSDIELYVDGRIKWDGCSHVFFGEKGNNEERDGYIHLRGKSQWAMHCEVMMKIYELAEKTIVNFDANISNM